MPGVSVRRSLLCLALCVALAAAPAAAQRAKVEFSDEAVAEAIEKGKEFFWRAYDAKQGCWPGPKGYEGGHASLALLALLSAGQSYQDARMKRALKWLSEVETQKTYVLGLRAQVWGFLPREIGRPYMKKDMDLLLRSIGQPAEGWPAKLAVAIRTPGTIRWGSYGYVSSGKPGGGDHSNTQFGILGVWAAARYGMETPRRYWQLVFEHFKATQNADGGWSYGYAPGGGQKSSLNMSAAGLANSFVAFDNLFNEQFVKCGVNADVPVLKRGLNWFDKNFGVVQGGWGHYGMYAVERVGLASGYKYFGDKNWYKIGATRLLQTQRNGGWGGVVNSAFAMLFLVRGRAPVLFNRLEYDGDWNNRPRALANLMRWTGRQFEHEVNWQIINLKVPVEEWHDAPILLMTGSRAPKLTDEQLQKLRDYVWQGGLLMTVGECGRRLRNAFDRAWRGVPPQMGRKGIPGLYAKLFPGYELTKLPDDHPIYTAHYKLKRKTPLWGVSNGVRLLALHTYEDLPLPWQTNAFETSKPMFQLAFNIVFYTTDRASLRFRGTSPWPEKKPFVPLRVARVARVKYNGNWDPEPLAWDRFSRMMGRHWQTRLVTKVLPLTELDAKTHRLAALTGTGALSLTDRETQALKSYLRAGGTVVMDAAGGSKAFGDGAAAPLEDLLADGTLRRLSAFSPVYQMKGMEINSVAYRRAAVKRFGESKTPRLMALMVKGRAAVFLSLEDLTAGLVGYPCYTCVGYKPGTPEKPGSAEKLMRNIVFYGIKPRKPTESAPAPVRAATAK